MSIVHRWQRVDVDSIEFLSGSSGCFESSSANRQSRAEPNDEMTSSTSSSSPCFFAFFCIYAAEVFSLNRCPCHIFEILEASSKAPLLGLSR